VLARVKREYVARHYGIPGWRESEDFLSKLAEKSGKLIRKGEPDLVAVAKTVLYDWQRGRLPYFKLPPLPEGEETRENGKQKGKVQEKGVVKNKDEVGDEDTIEEATPTVADVSISQTFKHINVKHDYLEEDLNAEGKGVILDDGPDWDELFQSVENGSDDELIEGNENGSEQNEGEEDDDDEDEEEAVTNKENEKTVKSAGGENVVESDENSDSEDELVWDSDSDGTVAAPPPKKMKTTKTDTALRTPREKVEAPSAEKPRINGSGKKTPLKNQDKSRLIEGSSKVVSFGEAVEQRGKKRQRGRGANRKKNSGGELLDEEDEPRKKGPRTVIKKKKIGIHFYETANVKNRNRSKKQQ